MWWALAAAALPYVMQQFQGQPSQPHTPGEYLPPDRSNYDSQLLNNAFNPHSELFQRSADVVNENIQHNLAKAGILGSSGGQAMQANVQGTLAAKWLEEQTARQRMALNAVNSDELARAHGINEFNNQQYQYGAAGYNRTNSQNAAQIAGLTGMVGAGANIYGQQQTSSRLDANAAAYRDMLTRMGPSPSYGAPGPQVNYMPDQFQFGGATDPTQNAYYQGPR